MNTLLTNCRIIVITDFKIYLYNFQNLKLIDMINTITNIKSLCAISSSKDVFVLAAPDKKVGAVRIVHSKGI